MRSKSFFFRSDCSSEELEQLAIVEQAPTLIKFMDNTTERVQIHAIEKDHRVLRYIKDPSNKVKLVASTMRWLKCLDKNGSSNEK